MNIHGIASSSTKVPEGNGIRDRLGAHAVRTAFQQRGDSSSRLDKTAGEDALAALPQRLGEIARIVMSEGETTAAQVCRAAGGRVSISAIRSMLSRLVEKGVLRRKYPDGPVVYCLATDSPRGRENLLRRFSEDHYGGCLERLSADLQEILRRRTDGHSEAHAQRNSR